MYKLTYETDEDVFGPETEETNNGTKPSSKGNSIIEKSDHANSQNHLTTYPNYETPDVEGKERSETMASTVDAVYAVVNKDKKKAADKPDVKGNREFYSMFTDSTDSVRSKEKSASLAKGCKFCLLILYLAILTAAVVILFVSGFHLRNENYILKHRLSALEESIIFHAAEKNPSASPGKGNEGNFLNWRKGVLTAQLSVSESNNEVGLPSPPPFPEATFIASLNAADSKDESSPSHIQRLSQNHKNGPSCCDKVRKSVSIMSLKTLRQSHVLETSNRRLNHILSRATDRVAELENDLIKLTTRVDNEMEAEKNTELHLLDINNKIETIAGEISGNLEESFDENSIERTVAFHAYRATVDAIVEIQEISTEDLFEFEPLSQSRRFTLSYNYELINRRQDMNPKTGVFTVPFSGSYVFYISFCTTENSEQTTLILMRDKTPLHTFRVPIVSSQSNTFALNPEFPPFSIPSSSKKSNYTESNTVYNSYSVVSELRVGEKVKLQLVSGTIVEMTSRNGKEDQSCTKFSGFKIR